jgi:hypothetical protein
MNDRAFRSISILHFAASSHSGSNRYILGLDDLENPDDPDKIQDHPKDPYFPRSILNLAIPRAVYLGSRCIYMEPFHRKGNYETRGGLPPYCCPYFILARRIQNVETFTQSEQVQSRRKNRLAKCVHQNFLIQSRSFVDPRSPPRPIFHPADLPSRSALVRVAHANVSLLLSREIRTLLRVPSRIIMNRQRRIISQF